MDLYQLRGPAFSGFLLPLLGLNFLPFTTIVFCLMFNPAAGGGGGASRGLNPD